MVMEKTGRINESPEFVRVSSAAAITLGLVSGSFLRNARLYCLNFLVTYKQRCAGRCAYCGLSRTRGTLGTRKGSFIRVDWPTVNLNEVLRRMDSESCSHVKRVCVSMETNRRARDDVIFIVKKLRTKIEAVSGLISPTIVDKKWLIELKEAGADKIGVAVDAATPDLFDELRGRGVQGPHRWDRYWKTVEEGLEIFGKSNVGVHLIVGLGETEAEMVRTIQRAHDMGAPTHLFSFFPERGSPMESCEQPPIGHYRRVQLARYLINKGIATAEEMEFDDGEKIRGFGISGDSLDKIIDSGLPFMTSGCAGKGMDNACNRPFSDCTPYQAYLGELRNYPFKPTKEDVELIRKQLWEYPGSRSHGRE